MNIKKKSKLHEFVEMHGQPKVAQIFGIHQTAVSKALASGRNIDVYEFDDGTVNAVEVRQFPSRKITTSNS